MSNKNGLERSWGFCMDKKKVLWIVTGSIAAAFVLIVVLCLAMVGIMMFISAWDEDYFADNIKIQTKQEAFEVLLEHQEEFEALVQDMEKLYQESGERVLIVRGRKEYRENGLGDGIAMEYSTYYIAAQEEEEGFFVSLNLMRSPDYFIEYWGIYYSQNDVPEKSWGNVELEEGADGTYSQADFNYRYETEKITDHWWYFQMRKRSSSDDRSLYRQE